MCLVSERAANICCRILVYSTAPPARGHLGNVQQSVGCCVVDLIQNAQLAGAIGLAQSSIGSVWNRLRQLGLKVNGPTQLSDQELRNPYADCFSSASQYCDPHTEVDPRAV